MKGPRATGHVLRFAVSVAAALLLSSAWAGGVSALPYDNTNPGSTPCGDFSHTIYTLGNRTASSPSGTEGIPVKIMAGTKQVGTVQIRHSAYCATVWAKVYNTSGVTTQVKEAIVTFSDSNGSGRSEHWKQDTVADGGNNTSNQYRDRPSFSARGGVLYNGTWYYAETSRAVAWAQYQGDYAKNPYACQHSFIWPCNRWPTTAGGGSGGASIGLYYFKDFGLSQMPNGSGGYVDVRTDVDYMFGSFNAVPGGSPVFSPTTGNEDLIIYSASLSGTTLADANDFDYDGDGLWDYGRIRMSTNQSWTHNKAREVLCHEIDHVMGLNHVTARDANNIDVVGSKATCVGMWSATGPLIDDEQALAAIYSGVSP